MPRKLGLMVAVSTFLGCLPMFATGPSFHPDATFTGSSLTGWHTFGQAEWRAENGEVVATPKGGGGWLVLDRSYQDIGVFAQFRCAAACETDGAPGVPDGITRTRATINAASAPAASAP